MYHNGSDMAAKLLLSYAASAKHIQLTYVLDAMAMFCTGKTPPSLLQTDYSVARLCSPFQMLPFLQGIPCFH